MPVTIYEKRSVIGGLNTSGVAPYKMKAQDALREVEWVLSIGGVQVRTEVEVGKDIRLSELEQKHDALLLAFGLGPDRYLKVPGSDLDGIYGAVDFIEQFKLGTVSLQSVRTAVVVGGGNTALDAVRELRGLGLDDVLLLYRGTEKSMSGYEHEWKAGKLEGVRGIWRSQPIAFEGKDRVQRVRCVRLDEQKVPIDGGEYTVAADLVLLAIGQNRLSEIVSELDGVEVKEGRIVVSERGETTRPGIYAAGDCANGGTEVVYAAAEGKRAAQAIAEYFERSKQEEI